MTSSCDVRESMTGEVAIRPMEYPILHDKPGSSGLSVSNGENSGAVTKPDARAEEFARQLEAVRREAIEQGKQTAAAESSAWRQHRAAELAGALEAFRNSQDSYLAQVEKEVVRLALAIAERILNRESQLDPLLLSGAVRRALGQVANCVEVRLRVAAEQRELWAEVVRLMPGLPLRPQVVVDTELKGCAVILESSLGMVDLSVHAQLREIEAGVFDRIERSRDQDLDLEAVKLTAERRT